MHERPVLVVSPRDDAAFRELAEQLVADGVAAADALEVALRMRYPKTVVRARDLAGERAVVWYVYREGRWTGQADTQGG